MMPYAIPKINRPSIRPFVNFDAEADANALRKAMKGLGCDNKEVISIICGRSNSQRQQIATMYQELFDRDLKEDLKDELRGDFEDLILALMTPKAEFDAEVLHKSLARIGTKESRVIEILASRSHSELEEIKNVYQQKYGNSLEHDIKSDTSGYFKRLLILLCTTRRDESNRTDATNAQKDAELLYKAGQGRLGTDESMFSAILTSQNKAQLRLVFDQYAEITGRSIEDAIKKEFSGDICDAWLAVVSCIRDPPTYFASRIQASVKGLGTHDKNLIRLIVTRSEIDLADVRDEFARLQGKTLEHTLKWECSGSYKDALIALVRGN